MGAPYKTLWFSDYFDQTPQADSHMPDPADKPSEKMSVCAVIIAIAIVSALVYLLYTVMQNGSCGKAGFLSSRAASSSMTLDSDESIKSTLEGKGDKVIMFHASWCGHCKTAFPAYQEAAKTNACGVTCFSADENAASPALLQQYNVKGYPTFMKVSDGKAKYHNGARSVEALKSFICS